jgi:hypothetical protein
MKMRIVDNTFIGDSSQQNRGDVEVARTGSKKEVGHLNQWCRSCMRSRNVITGLRGGGSLRERFRFDELDARRFELPASLSRRHSSLHVFMRSPA